MWNSLLSPKVAVLPLQKIRQKPNGQTADTDTHTLTHTVTADTHTQQTSFIFVCKIGRYFCTCCRLLSKSCLCVSLHIAKYSKRLNHLLHTHIFSYMLLLAPQASVFRLANSILCAISIAYLYTLMCALPLTMPHWVCVRVLLNDFQIICVCSARLLFFSNFLFLMGSPLFCHHHHTFIRNLRQWNVIVWFLDFFFTLHFLICYTTNENYNIFYGNYDDDEKKGWMVLPTYLSWFIDNAIAHDHICWGA